MFKVENADFVAEKLAAELLPNQEFREVLKNSLEAVERRMFAQGLKNGGRIEFDVDWDMFANTRRWLISCADNGDGMTRSELERYTTTLAVQGAGRSQSLRGNQGMGLKISGPTRHKKGVLIRSLKIGERTMVQIGWDGAEYGLIPIGQSGELVASPRLSTFPKFVSDQGSGTVVTFLGNTDDANTFIGGTRGWLFKYLNTRFFRLSDDGITVVVRVPSGDLEEWPRNAVEAAERMRREGGRSFNLTVVKGTGAIWDDAADKGGSKSVVSLPGDLTAGVPPAKLHWWVLPAAGTDVSSRTNSGGSIAVLYQNELHDWKTSNQANPYFARLGVLFGKSRIGFILEPDSAMVASDFARAHILFAGVPVFDSDAWLLWSEQFRAQMPEQIRAAMAEEQARLQGEDPDRIRRIRERLREVMQLLRPRRFRRGQQGEVKAGGPEIIGPGPGTGPVVERPIGSGTHRNRGDGTRGIGAVLAELDEDAGTAATEVVSARSLAPMWVTEEQADEMAIVNGNSNGLHDRAAALAGTDGRIASLLLLNKNFRGYQTILAAVNDWANPEGNDAKVVRIEELVREWIEQKMIEAIEGLRQLENGKTWITEHYDEAFSPVALTAAFMADRYHTLREVKRAVGALRQIPAAAS